MQKSLENDVDIVPAMITIITIYFNILLCKDKVKFSKIF